MSTLGLDLSSEVNLSYIRCLALPQVRKLLTCVRADGTECLSTFNFLSPLFLNVFTLVTPYTMYHSTFVDYYRDSGKRDPGRLQHPFRERLLRAVSIIQCP